MHTLDRLAQDWIEGRNIDDNHWIASQIEADHHLGVINAPRRMREYALHLIKVHTP